MYDRELTYEDLLEIERECDEIARRYPEIFEGSREEE